MDIEQRQPAQLPWLTTCLGLPIGIPSHDTIGGLRPVVEPARQRSRNLSLLNFKGSTVTCKLERTWTHPALTRQSNNLETWAV